MTARIHLISFLLITLLTKTLLSQGSGWETVFEVQWNQFLWDVKFINNSTGFACSQDSKLYKTTNAGLNWIIYQFHPQNQAGFNTVFFFNANTGFISADRAMLFKTTNGGESIDTIYPGGTDHFYSIYFPSRDTGYMATKYGGLFKTTNGGANWIIQQQPHSTGYRFWRLFCPTNNIAYATGIKTDTPYYQVCRTLNGGLNWEGCRIESAGWIYNVYFTSTNTGFVVGDRTVDIPPYPIYYEGLIYKTTNGGNNWILKLVDSSSSFDAVFFINQSTGFVAGRYGSSIAKTTDAGESWNINRDNIFWGLTSIYFADENTGVAVGYSRIIRTTNGGEPIGIKPISTEIPNMFSLFQNYPNPFNPTTKIKFSLPAVGERHSASGGFHTTLIIYDALGREVQTLVNEKLSPGTYEVNFDGSSLSSGVYFYRVTAGDFTDTKKLILLK
jgi:photosystem II stability/assembly factor-like uncharacterized protein